MRVAIMASRAPSRRVATCEHNALRTTLCGKVVRGDQAPRLRRAAWLLSQIRIRSVFRAGVFDLINIALARRISRQTQAHHRAYVDRVDASGVVGACGRLRQRRGGITISALRVSISLPS
jgi:hypothetical protein